MNAKVKTEEKKQVFWKEKPTLNFAKIKLGHLHGEPFWNLIFLRFLLEDLVIIDNKNLTNVGIKRICHTKSESDLYLNIRNL